MTLTLTLHDCIYYAEIEFTVTPLSPVKTSSEAKEKRFPNIALVAL